MNGYQCTISFNLIRAADSAIQTMGINSGAARVLERAGGWELWEIQPRRGRAAQPRAQALGIGLGFGGSPAGATQPAPPLQGSRLSILLPGLTPWAVLRRPCGAGCFGARHCLNRRGGGLAYAKARHQSLYGPVASGWELADARLKVTVAQIASEKIGNLRRQCLPAFAALWCGMVR
jgi:hypothetical protein